MPVYLFSLFVFLQIVKKSIVKNWPRAPILSFIQLFVWLLYELIINSTFHTITTAIIF